jgi:hypothetical protein
MKITNQRSLAVNVSKKEFLAIGDQEDQKLLNFLREKYIFPAEFFTIKAPDDESMVVCMRPTRSQAPFVDPPLPHQHDFSYPIPAENIELVKAILTYHTNECERQIHFSENTSGSHLFCCHFTNRRR